MSEQVLRGVSCPACGGSLDVQEGTLIFSCKFCKAQLLVRGERGVSRYYVALEHQRQDVIAKVAKWFQSYDKAADLRTAARFADVFPVFVPFWNIRGQMRGWMLGENKKTRDKETYWEPVEREIRENHELTHPACDIGEFGVKWVDLKGDTILPFDLESVQKQGMTFGVLSSRDEALQSASETFQDWSESAQKIDRVSFSKIHLVNQDCRLVYYPLWIIRYEYRNRTYQVAIDGQSGDLLYGRAPGNNLYRVYTFLGSIMAANFLLTTIFRSVDLDHPGTYLVLFLIAFSVMYWGYKKFRYGGEVKLEQKDAHAPKRADFGLPLATTLPPQVENLLKNFNIKP